MSPELPPDLQKVVRILPCSEQSLIDAMEWEGWVEKGRVRPPHGGLDLAKHFKVGSRLDRFDDWQAITFYFESSSNSSGKNGSVALNFIHFEKTLSPDLRNIGGLLKYEDEDPNLSKLFPVDLVSLEIEGDFRSAAMELELHGLREIREYLAEIDEVRELRWAMLSLLNKAYRLGRRVRERELGPNAPLVSFAEKTREERKDGGHRGGDQKQKNWVGKIAPELKIVDEMAEELTSKPRKNTGRAWKIRGLAEAILKAKGTVMPTCSVYAIESHLRSRGWVEKLEEINARKKLTR